MSNFNNALQEQSEKVALERKLHVQMQELVEEYKVDITDLDFVELTQVMFKLDEIRNTMRELASPEEMNCLQDSVAQLA